MTKTHNNSANIYRNLNSKFIFILVTILLLWALIQQASMPDLISRDKVSAIVMEIRSSSNSNNHQTTLLIKLKLPNNNTCKVITSINPHPKTGDTIPLYLEKYDNNTAKCVVDHQTLTVGKIN